VTHLRSALFGALIALAGTFLHNSYQPVGLIVSLVALVWSLYLVGQMYKGRSHLFAFSLAWIAVIIRGSMIGNGNELLIEGNSYGNLFAFGGSLTIAVMIIIARYDR
jgi:hypothetical protein